MTAAARRDARLALKSDASLPRCGELENIERVLFINVSINVAILRSRYDWLPFAPSYSGQEAPSIKKSVYL